MNILNEDITNISFGIIAHQVNCVGRMGSGVALAIRRKWPIVFDKYKKYQFRLGDIQIVKITQQLFICNLAGQYYYGKDRQYTDYSAVDLGFDKLKRFIISNNINIPLCIPYLMGCGTGGGNWEIYKDIVFKYFPNVLIYKYK